MNLTIRKLGQCFIGMALILGPSQLFAFKVGTHIWVAQEVINNLTQCEVAHQKSCITVDMAGAEKVIPIPVEVKTAILEYPEYFRNGSIGPDAYPDVIVGQMIIHPGVTKNDGATAAGFGTSDWLHHLLQKAQTITDPIEKKKAIAFTYGFFCHVAADIFAHTYVNSYAGDIFSLGDGEDDVELRHMALEDYIQSKTPEITDTQGNILGKPEQLIMKNDQVALPLDFISSHLIFDPEAQKQFEIAQMGMHFVLVAQLLNELNTALVTVPSNMSNIEFLKSIGGSYLKSYRDTAGNDDKDVDKMFKHIEKKWKEKYPKGGSMQKMEIIAVQILAYYYLNLDLDAQQATKVSELLDGFMTYQSKKTAVWDKKRNDIDGKVMGIYNTASESGVKIDEQFGSARRAFLKALDNYKAAVDDQTNKAAAHQIATRKLADERAKKLCIQVGFASCGTIKKFAGLVKVPCIRNGLPKLCNVDKFDDVIDPVCEANVNACNATHQAHNAVVSTLENGVVTSKTALDSATTKVNKRIAAATDAFNKLKTILQATNQNVNASYKKFKAMESGLLSLVRDMSEGHRQIVTEWTQDIRNAMQQYSVANGQAIRNTIDESEATKWHTPLMDWKTCYLPSIMGVPQEALNITTCAGNEFKHRYTKLIEKVEEAVRKIDPKVAGRILTIRDEILKEGPFLIASKLDGPFGDAVGTKKYNLAKTVHLITKETTATSLNQQFCDDHTQGKNLLLICDMALRARIDMGISGEGPFQANGFPVAKNAITLASLALANRDGLNELAAPGEIDGLVKVTDMPNILTKSIRSIDGNHQWMPLAPPYPRQTTVKNDKLWPASAANGNNILRRYSSLIGFPLFTQPKLKADVFDKLFVGPLNPSLFEARELNLSVVLPLDYSYAPTQSNPFPAKPN